MDCGCSPIRSVRLSGAQYCCTMLNTASPKQAACKVVVKVGSATKQWGFSLVPLLTPLNLLPVFLLKYGCVVGTNGAVGMFRQLASR